MLWKKINRQKVGGLLRAKNIAELQSAIEQLGRLQANPPLTLKQTPGGPIIAWAGPVVDFGWFWVTSAIPAARGTQPTVTPGSGQGTQYFYDAYNTQQMQDNQLGQVTLYNVAPFAVGGNGGLVACVLKAGYWFVVNDVCSGG